MPDEPGFPAGDLDRLAERAVASLLRLVRRAMALAGGVLIIAAFCCLGGFLLGLAALSGGIRSVWVVVGGGFLVVGVGAVIVAMWRLRTVRHGADALVGEIRRMLGQDPQAERVVIETIEVSDGVEQESAIVLSRKFAGIGATASRQSDSYGAITDALRTVTRFPLLLGLSAVVSFVFAGLGLLFLIALAL